MKQGPFPSPPVLLSARLKRYYEPLRHPPGRTRLHGATAYTRPSLPGQQLPQAGAGEGFPSSRTHRATVPLPLPRGVHRRCTSRVFTASVAFTVHARLGSPLSRTQAGKSNGAAGFASRYGPDRSHAPTGRLTLGSDAGRFPPTPPACYPAPWHLPGPDSHRQADTSLCPDQILEGITLRTLGARWSIYGMS